VLWAIPSFYFRGSYAKEAHVQAQKVVKATKAGAARGCLTRRPKKREASDLPKVMIAETTDDVHPPRTVDNNAIRSRITSFPPISSLPFYDMRMPWITFFSLLMLVGCESSRPATTQPTYHPADGRNLSPQLQNDFGADPQWPNDINRGGGGRH
jgi:hypothetical protein